MGNISQSKFNEILKLCKAEYPHFTPDADVVYSFLVSKGLSMRFPTYQCNYHRNIARALEEWRIQNGQN